MTFFNKGLLINPHRLCPETPAWMGHIPFAGWLIVEHKPTIMVELGTHLGVSYSGFCQAVVENKLTTKCYAVDTWLGDEHSGQYSDEIYADFSAYHAQHFSSFSQLLRMTFDEAVSYFSDNSIDLLHIDGMHTYDSVKHDFNTWLPKMSERGVMLFHDITVRENGFGVWALWEELSKKYPFIEFKHCNGLGVLFVGNKNIESMHLLQDKDANIVNELFCRLGEVCMQRNREKTHIQTINSLKQSVDECDSQIAHLQQVVDERDSQIAHLQQVVDESDSQIAHLQQVVDERDSQIAHLNQVVDERDSRIANLNQVIDERDSRIANLNQVIDERDSQFTNLNQVVNECDSQIATLLDSIKSLAFEKENYITESNVHINNLNITIRALQSSRSWKITTPFRAIVNFYTELMRIKHFVVLCLRSGGGVKSLFIKAIRIYKRGGFAGVIDRLRWLKQSQSSFQVKEQHVIDRNDYSAWIKCFDTLNDNDRKKIKDEVKTWKKKPKISIVMPVYNPPLAFLQRAVESVHYQLYSNWELCIADDASSDPVIKKYLERIRTEDKRVKVIYRSKNGHISATSNSALNIATGDYVALMDHDDLIAEHALYWVAKEIINNPNAAIIYSDEDKVDDKDVRSSPYFKSDWNLFLFRSHNMISHLGVYKRALVDEVGGFRVGFEGSQDYDLALRCIEKLEPKNIVHIPRVLYHWRIHAGSTSLAAAEKPYAASAGLTALDEHLKRMDIGGKVSLLPISMYRVHYSLPESLPLITLIIPTRNAKDLVEKCINSILSKTTYSNYEILLIDNGSDDLDAIQNFKQLESNAIIRVLRDDRAFNYSALNNRAVEESKGEIIALINNDIEIISPDWLSEMVAISLQLNVGAVGACLWYPDDRLQHGGVIIGLGGVAEHAHKFMPRGHHGYFGRAVLIQEMSAVTAACLVIKKSIYQEVHGLDEHNLKVAFNDVDFCLRLREAGYTNVWTPYAELYHHESATRGLEDTPEKFARFAQEVLYMQERWKGSLVIDPAYNTNLSLEHSDFSLAWPPRFK